MSTSKSAGMEQPKSLRTGSTTMIDIVLAPLSHTDLQNRGLGPFPLHELSLRRRPTQRPMSQSNRADGIERRR